MLCALTWRHCAAEVIIETLRRDGNVLLPVDTAARVLEILLWLNEVHIAKRHFCCNR